MGQRGRPKTPTRVLQLRGSWRAKQREKGEVQLPAKKPSCPRWLDKDARDVWHLLLKDLAAVGLVTKLERNALTRYCRLFARWMNAEKHLQKHGTTIATKKQVVSAPEVREADSLASQLLRLEQNFGLTPSARASLQTSVEKKQDDAKARFFK